MLKELSSELHLNTPKSCIAISIYVLVVIVKNRLNMPLSIYTNLQILSVTLFAELRN